MKKTKPTFLPWIPAALALLACAPRAMANMPPPQVIPQPYQIQTGSGPVSINPNELHISGSITSGTTGQWLISGTGGKPIPVVATGTTTPIPSPVAANATPAPASRILAPEHYPMLAAGFVAGASAIFSFMGLRAIRRKNGGG